MISKQNFCNMIFRIDGMFSKGNFPKQDFHIKIFRPTAITVVAATTAA